MEVSRRRLVDGLDSDSQTPWFSGLGVGSYFCFFPSTLFFELAKSVCMATSSFDETALVPLLNWIQLEKDCSILAKHPGFPADHPGDPRC